MLVGYIAGLMAGAALLTIAAIANHYAQAMYRHEVDGLPQKRYELAMGRGTSRPKGIVR